MSTIKAVKADVTATDLTIEFDGLTFTVPPSSQWDVEVLEAIEDGKTVGMVRSLLGDAQYAKFKNKRRTISDLEALMEAIQEAVGAGN